MTARLVFEVRFSLALKNGKILTVFMDLYKLPSATKKKFPGGYRFSWIAFDPEDENHRVLFDTHPPKGPHIHFDREPAGIPFHWTSLEAAKALFFDQIQQHFGELSEEPDL